ncbi:MAG: methionyl-tRNA formyltransferase [Candidatus Sabulitectum sp.]|nr:methionyl-tRNA formyltransferase [Candidatus Sabulitectum sp.]
MKLIFLGTSAFALPALKALHNTEDIQVSLVISRPDRRSGRGRKITRPPVAILADELGIRLLQPEKLTEIRDMIKEMLPDVMVSASYGGWLPDWFLGIAPLGVVNIHPSLLPWHRGAAPIIRTILDGDKITAVSFMITDNGWDTGDILYTINHELTGYETAGELEDSLAESAASSLSEVLTDYANGTLKAVPQAGAESYAEKVTSEEAMISWKSSADEIRRMVLAFNPVPGARTVNRTGLLKIYSAETSTLQGRPGEVLEEVPLVVGCGSDSLRLLEVQPQGKRRMTSAEYVRGYRIRKGVLLSEE